jgi:hypothetical protein
LSDDVFRTNSTHHTLVDVIVMYVRMHQKCANETQLFSTNIIWEMYVVQITARANSHMNILVETCGLLYLHFNLFHICQKSRRS